VAISTKELLLATVYSLVLGTFFGASYDIIRIFRVLLGVSSYGKRKTFEKAYGSSLINYFSHLRIRKLDGLIMFLTDMIFSLFVTLCFVLFLFSFNHSIFRWFILLFTVLGFLIYYFTVGKIVILFSQEIAAFIFLVLNVILHLIIVPVKKICSFLKLIFNATFSKLYAYVKNAIDRKKKKRYTVKCTEELSKIVEFKV